jgi:signal transduction histidine kinase
MEALREFAYGAGHEINNPLANIAARAQTLLTDEPHPDRRRALAAINAQAFRAHEMIADVMLLARPPEMKLRPVNLRESIQAALARLQPQAEEQGTSLGFRSPAGQVMISGDQVQLGVAIQALVQNSLDALGRGGSIAVELEVAQGESSPVARVHITDTGPGISDEVLPKIFDPFFSGREAGRGLGFGLPKCWQIVTQHQGSMAVSSRSGHGAHFTIELPIGTEPD